MKSQNLSAIPIVLILTRKRDLSFKCRAVCLGNKQALHEGEELFAAVIGASANRYLLFSSAHAGCRLRLFDLDNAFLNAELTDSPEDRIFVRLPAEWRESVGDNGIRRLWRSLYGLRCAPRRWWTLYSTHLKSLGWEESIEAQGMWRKPSKLSTQLALTSGSSDLPVAVEHWLRLSVYVDDNIMGGGDVAEVDSEIALINERFPGRRIESVVSRGENGETVEYWDILGADVDYSHDGRWCKITMKNYIKKTLEKFQIACPKDVYGPCFDEEALEKGKPVEAFPLRGVLGSLNWISTQARPDITQPVSVLSRYASLSPPPQGLVNACRKVLRYLNTTIDHGVLYSKENECEFEAIYAKLLPEGRPLPARNSFSDASFASCFRTLKSTSGSICYWRGAAIVWRAARQTIRTHSTAESEYVAASDTIVVSESCGFTSFFDPLPLKVVKPDCRGIVKTSQDAEDEILWIDNESAITIANSSETRPKSRHYALRWFRVRDFSDGKNIAFCPTHLQKADALTKVNCSSGQRMLLLHHINPKISQDFPQVEEDEEEEYSSIGFLILGDGEVVPVACQLPI